MKPEIDINTTPTPGYYRLRLVKKGPWVPARIWLDKGTLRASMRGEEVSMAGGAPPLWPWWPVEQQDYDFRMRLLAYVQKHDPESPENHPRRPIDLRKMPPRF